MNRIVIAAALALVAIGAGSVWAIGQFGGSSNPVVSTPRKPIVREPEITVTPAADPAPAQPTPAKPAPAKPGKPVVTPPKPEPKVEPPKADPAPATPEPAVTPSTTPDTPAQPQANTTPKNPLDAIKSRVNKEIDKAKDQIKPPVTAPATPNALDNPQATTPSTAPATTPEPQAAPSAQTTQPATPAQTAPANQARVAPAPSKPSEPAVQIANAPGVTQTAPPVGLEAQFKSRRVTYNRPPEKLALNKPVDVSLVVNATADESAGKEALEGFKGEIVEREVELSDTVSAQLTGVGFDITSQTVERQRLSGRTVNRWQWRVTPTEVGEHTLMLEIFGYASGSLDAEPLDAYRDVITVEVEQLDQIVSWAKGVQPLFAVLAALAGIGSAIFAFLRFREEKKQTNAMTPKGE